MKVYVLEKNYDYEGSDILGVFPSFKDAEAAADRFANGSQLPNIGSADNLRIEMVPYPSVGDFTRLSWNAEISSYPSGGVVLGEWLRNR